MEEDLLSSQYPEVKWALQVNLPDSCYTKPGAWLVPDSAFVGLKTLEGLVQVTVPVGGESSDEPVQLRAPVEVVLSDLPVQVPAPVDMNRRTGLCRCLLLSR